MKAEWTLPWPPTTTNNLYRNLPRGGRAMVPEARAWKDGATLMVKAAGQSLPDGRLVMSLQLFPPKGFRGDTSNCVKLVEDAVFAAFGETDHRVCELHVYRNERGLSQRIVVLVEDVRSHYAPS